MQSPWSFHFMGEPNNALASTSEIGGILPKQLVSLQELINIFNECNPVATLVEVDASETVGAQAIILQSVRFNSQAPGGNISFTYSGEPYQVKEQVGLQTNIEQWLRWSGRNACDQAMLTGAKEMSIQITQKVIGKQQSLCSVNYEF